MATIQPSELRAANPAPPEDCSYLLGWVLDRNRRGVLLSIDPRNWLSLFASRIFAPQISPTAQRAVTGFSSIKAGLNRHSRMNAVACDAHMLSVAYREERLTGIPFSLM